MRRSESPASVTKHLASTSKWEHICVVELKHLLGKCPQLCVFADWDPSCAHSLQAIHITLPQDISQNIQPVTGGQKRRLWREKPSSRRQTRRALTTTSGIQLPELSQMLKWVNPGHIRVKCLRSISTILNRTKISLQMEKNTLLSKQIPLRRRCRAMLRMESQNKVRQTRML